MPDEKKPTAQDESPVPRYRDAYQRLIEEIRHVPDSAVIHINIDIPTAVTTALGSLPDIKALRPRVVEELPKFDIDRFDKLESATLAAAQAHALFLAASAPPQSLDELVAKATPLREALLSDATALAARNLIDGEKLKELKGAAGFRNLAFDLFTLAAMLHERWSSIQGKTVVQLEELDQAEMLADQILNAVAQRDRGPGTVVEATDIRQKAFTLFVSTYDNARRAVTYLRWNDNDADEIAPSLYANRAPARRRQEPQPPAPPATPPAPTPTAGATPNAAPATVGLPNSDPFVRA